MRSPDLVVAEPGLLGRLLAARCANVLTRAVAARGRASFALTGGSAFRALGPALADAPLPWADLDIFWGDERAVPADHEDSNYRLAREVCLDRVPAPPGRVHRMEADRPGLDAAADAYAETLARTLGPGLGLDLVLLGLGPDGHVCSLFPGHPLLDERARSVAALRDAPKPPASRLTLTLPALLAASHLIVIALGATKRDAVRAAVEDASGALPVSRVVSGSASVLVLADPAAAADLTW
jgi:6-phosphogluconolactonase